MIAIKVLAVAFVIGIELVCANKCYNDNENPSRCSPKFINAAYLKDISANNTCGTEKPRLYCAQSRYDLQNICKTCDAKSMKLTHPASYMNDLSHETWWQSDTLFTMKYPVHIILDLGKTFEVTYIQLVFQSPRPYSFAIYKKSSTGKDSKWKPFQYYSQSCVTSYGMEPNQMLSRVNVQTALCSEKFSGIAPLRNGNVMFSTLYRRPGRFRFDDTPALQEWVTVAALRIDLDRMNTFGDEVFGDPEVLRSYYFAISNLVVGGRCKCNGHASECIEAVTDDGKSKLKCKCEHNTDGDDCQKCLPLFNDTPWKRATRFSANPCSSCNCNGLADSCVFDQQLYQTTGRGGRCVACKNNNDGVNCERCKIYHYRRERNEACKPCNCDAIGSKRPQCNSDGQCSCQPGVYGAKCDKCRPGYFGFSKTGCRQKEE